MPLRRNDHDNSDVWKSTAGLILSGSGAQPIALYKGAMQYYNNAAYLETLLQALAGDVVSFCFNIEIQTTGQPPRWMRPNS